MLGIIIFFGVIGGISDSLKNTNTQGPSQTVTNTVSTPKPTLVPIVVNANVLISEYDKNKIAAQDKYTGKTIQTNGIINNISTDFTGKYYLSLNPSSDQYYIGTSIACYFEDGSQKSTITALSKGGSVTVQGEMQDMSLGTIVLEKCQVVK